MQVRTTAKRQGQRRLSNLPDTEAVQIHVPVNLRTRAFLRLGSRPVQLKSHCRCPSLEHPVIWVFVLSQRTSHKDIVPALLWSWNKLKSLLPTRVYRQLAVVQGDATDVVSIKRAILDASYDASYDAMLSTQPVKYLYLPGEILDSLQYLILAKKDQRTSIKVYLT